MLKYSIKVLYNKAFIARDIGIPKHEEYNHLYHRLKTIKNSYQR